MLPSSLLGVLTSALGARLLFVFVSLLTSTPSVHAAGVVGSQALLQPPNIPLPGGAPSDAPQVEELQFSLRHLFHHGAQKYPNLHRRLDVGFQQKWGIASDEERSDGQLRPTLRVRTEPASIERMKDRSRRTIDQILDYAREMGTPADLPASAWTTDEIKGPNVTDQEGVLSLARMAANAYVEDHSSQGWLDVGPGFNDTEHFGWETDGIRGHIFADTNNKTVVVALKGTSPAVFDGEDTTTNDKINDNLFFSCCCAQGGQYFWKQVCDCMTSAYTCNSTCLVKELKEKNRYYYAAQDLYHNVTALYPNADFWIAGHSLGGAVGSLLALTYGLPVVTFEAPGEALPAVRLGLPTPPGYRVGSHQTRDFTGGYHFGHTADPIFMGSCDTANSFCTLGGYAMESVCHTGKTCTYDTVGDFGWRVGIGTHKILNVIRDVLTKYDKPALCEPRVNCTDCYSWKFYESNSSATTTKSSTSTSRTRTRTETCKTPGWWGCLDESTTTTTTTSSSSSSSTSSSTTCHTPGWFGCKDPTTTTSMTTTTVAAIPAPTITTTSRPTSSGASSTSCKHPGWLGMGCRDPSSTMVTGTRTSKGADTTPPPADDPWRAEIR